MTIFTKVDQGQSQERHWEEKRNVPGMFKKWQRSSVEDGQSEKKSEWKSMS